MMDEKDREIQELRRQVEKMKKWRKRGYWKLRSDLETYRIWECSECHIGVLHMLPYCPYCGANMYELEGL